MANRKKHKPEKKKSGWWIVGIVVGLSVGIALTLRIVLPYDKIFVGDWIKFSSIDAYFYMRLVDNMVHNFPHLMSFDSYAIYPSGAPIVAYYFFARLIAGISWLVGLGHPSEQLVDTVGVYVPAVMGALVVIPVYFIGKELWGRWAGMICAALIAVVPGEFMGRSILGFTDHHVAEVLFSATAMLFLIMALRRAKQEQVDFNNFKSKGGVRAITYGVLAGLVWGLYGLTWQSGALFLFITSLYFVVQFVIEHLRNQSVGYLCVVGVVFNLVAMVVFLPSAVHSSGLPFYLFSMGGALLLPLVLGALSWFMRFKKYGRVDYLWGVLGLGLFGLAILRVFSPALLKEITDVLVLVFISSPTQATTGEMQPLLFPQGSFTLALVWANFGVLFFIAVVALGGLIYMLAKNGDTGVCLLAVWTVVIIAIALGQRRFCYYLAVNVALLSGWFVWQGLKWTMSGTEKLKLVVKKKQYATVQAVNVGLMLSVAFLVLVVPMIPKLIPESASALYAPSDAWCESLEWLKENSSEPFGGTTGYWGMPTTGTGSNADYSVLSWWDYGYLITRVGHRVPNVNPGQQALLQAEAGKFFTAQDSDTGDEIANRLGVEYVIIDIDMATAKYWAMAEHAGGHYSDYFGLYYMAEGNYLKPLQVYYPAYYRSMATRLYNFGGMEVIPQDATAIYYEPRIGAEGRRFNLITQIRLFDDYLSAQDYVESQGGGNWMVVSDNPFASPIALEALDEYELVYSSSDRVTVGMVTGIPKVKIFQYKG